MAVGSAVTLGNTGALGRLRSKFGPDRTNMGGELVTVTENVQVLGLSEASVAVQVTRVTPKSKQVPDGGSHTNSTPGQLSLTLGSKVSTAQHFSASTGVAMFAGHTIDGAWPSFTVTKKVQELVFSAASEAVQVTVVAPTGKNDPEAGTQSTVAPGQLSVTSASRYCTTAPHWFGSEFTS
jgi:hypothetical protein